MKPILHSLVVTTLYIAALGSPAAFGQTSPAAPIKLGMSAALTGPFNEFGEGLRRGAVIAVEEWNKKGGVNGRKIELADVLDDQLMPDRAVQNMRRILDNKDIVGVIAPAGSGPALATVDMVEADGRPMCNPMAQSPAITYPKGTSQPPRKNVFSTAVTNAAESRRLAEVLAKSYKNVGVLNESTAYGTTGAELVKKSLGEINPAVKVNVEAYNQRSQDVTAQIVRLQRAGADVVLVIGLGSDFAMIRKNLSRLNVDVPLFGSNGATTVPYIEGAGDLALGTRSLSVPAFAQRPMTETAQRFLDAYRAAHGTDRWYGPDAANPLISMAAIVGSGYDCVNLLVDGIRRANSTEPAAVVRAIEQTKDLPGVAISAISLSPTQHDAFKPENLAEFVMVKRDGKVMLNLDTK
ncbi:ABC transporter substrate-binding protein [Variovorax sp. RHLX14]|uniref:ABC transporter substrate-binding protein n=1 Tax=Variovorax sp. RHLX14 TaxID=1259731 RepID=UPI003F46FAC3